MEQHDESADPLDVCRTALHELTPETAPCQGVRAVVQYLASLGKRAIGVGRATVTIEQLALNLWPKRAPVAGGRIPPWGWCQNPLLLRFYDDPDVWTLSVDVGDEFGPEDAGLSVREDEIPPSAFIRSHQEALIIHGGRYGLYEVYRIHNPDAPPEAWRWEKLSFLLPDEIRERIAGYLRSRQGFDGLYRRLVEHTVRGGISYRMVKDPELERLAGVMRELCKQYLDRLATLEEAYHRALPRERTPNASAGG